VIDGDTAAVDGGAVNNGLTH